MNALSEPSPEAGRHAGPPPLSVNPARQVRVCFPRPEGLHLRPAAQVVALSRRFRALVRLHANGRTADWRSILDLLLLEVQGGVELEIESTGEDRGPALAALLEVLGISTEEVLVSPSLLTG